MNSKVLRFKKKRLLIIFLILVLVFFSYWLKSQIGMNFFNTISLISYFPFKYLKSGVIKSPKRGILLDENFNTNRILKKWSDLWMSEEGTVTKHFSSDGFDNSRCLLIKNSSKGSWTYSHNRFVEVEKKDIFYYEGFVNITGDSLFAYMSVAAFDENKKVIDWNLFKEKVDRTGVWVGVQRQFTIYDDDIKYITFRFGGVGVGEYRFDNITFLKIK